MEKTDHFNIEGAYNELKEEAPYPWKAECTECPNELITQLDVSYLPEKDDRIKLLRPALCPECASELDKVLVKIVAEIAPNGKIYPKNKEGRL